MNRNILKSIWAIFAGMITGAVLSIGTDFILEKAGVFPLPDQVDFVWWMLLIALIYRGIYTITSGWVTAALAPNRPKYHAILLGIIGFVITLLGSIANRDKSAAWYPVALILITLPCTWFGGILYERFKKI